eukprot:7293343-Prymnesium_polylepis.1
MPSWAQRRCRAFGAEYANNYSAGYNSQLVRGAVECSGHGLCDEAGVCVCEDGWTGLDCGLISTEVRLGILLPMFGAEAAGYSPVSWTPRVGVYQALREINNKTDGVADHILPRIQIGYSYFDDRCDASKGLEGALHLTRSAADHSITAIIGAGCSGASMSAAGVARLEGIPIISPSSQSSALSDGKAYASFLRVVPSDAFIATAFVDVLMQLFHYSSVALVHATDAYSAGAASAMQQASHEAGLALSVVVSFPENAFEFAQEVGKLRQSVARVVVVFSQVQDGSNFVLAALEAGIGGEGYMWLSGI